MFAGLLSIDSKDIQALLCTQEGINCRNRQIYQSFDFLLPKYSQEIMTTKTNLLDQAIQFHEALPARIREYLHKRGIPDPIIDSNIIGWNGWRITIPIYNQQGEVVFFRLAKDPQDRRPMPKMLSSANSSVELYGWEEVLKRPCQIIVCEGEFDRLVLQSHGFAAVTSTGGAATFRPQWAQALEEIEEVYICFDNDQAGANGAQVATLMLPNARVVKLPDEVGRGGDVTDYFVRLGHTREEFVSLLNEAKPAPETPQEVRPAGRPALQSTNSLVRDRIQRIKMEVPIESVIQKYVNLIPSGFATLLARCPFHNDRTPSLAVYLQTGTYHCFGCRAHGDVISFVRAMENLSFAQALDALDQLTSAYAKKTQQDNGNEKAA